MKKPSPTSRTKRNKSASTKPVTIELEAKTVDKQTPGEKPVAGKPAAPSQARPKQSRTSVPASRTKPKSTSGAAPEPPKDAAKEKTTEPAKAEQQAKPAPAKPNLAKPNLAKPDPQVAKKPVDNKSGAGKFSIAVAAIIGGIVALTGWHLLNSTGLITSSQPQLDAYVSKETFEQRQQELAQLIGDLETRLGEIPSNTGLDEATVLATIDRRLAETNAALDAGAGEAGASIDEIITQLNEATVRVENLQSTQQEISAKVDDMQSSLSAGAAGESVGLTALSTRVDEFAIRMESINDDIAKLNETVSQPPSNPEPNEQTVAQLNEHAAKLEQLEDLSGNVSALSTTIDALKQRLEENAQTLASNNTALETLSTAVGVEQNRGALAAQSLAAAAVKNDIDQGRPFDQSLALLKSVSQEPGLLDEISSFADTGIATTTELASEFESLKSALALSVQPPVEEGDVGSRLLEGMKSLVKVKPTSPLAGDGPVAVITQIAQSLATADLKTAANQWANLPEAAQAVSRDWHDRLQSRIAADSLIGNSIEAFLKSNSTQ